jgi:hypothetical protein
VTLVRDCSKIEILAKIMKFSHFRHLYVTLNFYPDCNFILYYFKTILLHNLHLLQAFLSFTRSQAAPALQVKLHKFCDLCNDFCKKRSTSIMIFSKKEKDISFSGRFSESWNDCISLELQLFSSNLIAFRCKTLQNNEGLRS